MVCCICLDCPRPTISSAAHDGIYAITDGELTLKQTATPLVSGIAAYLRGLPSKWKTDLEDPRLLKSLIKLLQRQIPAFPVQPAVPNFKAKVPTVWNGQVFEYNCLCRRHQEARRRQGRFESCRRGCGSGYRLPARPALAHLYRWLWKALHGFLLRT